MTEDEKPKELENRSGAAIICTLFYVVTIIIALLVGSQDWYLTSALLVLSFGNLFLGFTVYAYHRWIVGTNKYPKGHLFVKNTSAFLESGLYSVLLAFNLSALLVGVLITKTVGNVWVNKNESKTNEGLVVATFRSGFVLQVVLVIVVAILLSKSIILKPLSLWLTDLVSQPKEMSLSHAN